MKKLLLSLVLSAVAFSVFAQQKRLALVIGNGNYSNSILANPENDARDIEAALKNLGFVVVRRENLDQKTMNTTIEDFGNRLKNYDVGLFFYAGHGIQSKGFNYLIPVDAAIKTESDVEMNCVRADKVLGKMEDARSKMNIVILDACRDNPYERSWNRAARSRGLATMTAPVGSIIGYSTAPGMTASDGSGKNSPYTSALLTYITDPGITIEQMFKKVRTLVISKSGGQQQPWESTNMTGDFYFAGSIALTETDIGVPAKNEVTAGIVGSDRSMPEKSIGVLPFKNYTGDPEKEFFVEGQWDALVNELSTIGSWLVKGRSSMKYKDSDLTIPQIASELGVDYIIEGSVLGSGDTVRIVIRLNQAFPEEKAILVQSYDRDKRHILSLHSDVTREIAQKIKVTLSPDEEKKLARSRPIDPQAYDAYVKGTFYWKKLDRESLEISKKYFELAMKKDSLFAPSYQGIATVWLGQAQMGYLSPEVAGPEGMKYLMKSLELDSTSAEAHYMLALTNTWIGWDWEAGESEFRKTITANPNLPEAHAYYSHLLCILRRNDEARKHIEMALILDPYNSLIQSLASQVYLVLKEYDTAIGLAKKALITSPGDLVASNGLYTSYFLSGQFDKGLDGFKLFFSGFPGFSAAIDSGYQKSGFQGALVAGRELLQKLSSEGTFVNPTFFVDFYYYTGEQEKSIEWMEKGYDIHDQNMPYFSTTIYDPLRKYPRFMELLKKMNLP